MLRLYKIRRVVRAQAGVRSCPVEVEHALHEKCLIMKFYAPSVMHSVPVPNGTIMDRHVLLDVRS